MYNLLFFKMVWYVKWYILSSILQYDEKGEKGYGFFESSIMDGQHLSEDYSFCERVKSIGEKVYIDPSIELSHHGGNIRFYGNYNEHLKYGNKK